MSERGDKGAVPIAALPWTTSAPTVEETRADVLALLRYAERLGGLDALDRPGAVAEALRDVERSERGEIPARESRTDADRAVNSTRSHNHQNGVDPEGSA